jgi:ABC-type multidrug transport system ATPase subunit
MGMELKITKLSKTYKNGVKALDNVSLTIPRGMYGLLGPNEVLMAYPSLSSRRHRQ